MGQFSAATQGDASLQASHPSAQGRHSYEFRLLYDEISLWKSYETKYKLIKADVECEYILHHLLYMLRLM